MKNENEKIFFKIYEIIGDKKKGIIGIIPMGRTCWFRNVKNGTFPQPVRISKRTTFWTVESIKKLIDDISNKKV